ncbi:MAG TPA: hypothetical protein VFE24_12975, partial [Pirellulales bacterium]|nr:hypothetical protein [Pirellulales bacterium]
MRNLAVLLAVVGLASIGGSIWAYCHDRSLADPVYLASQIQFEPDPVQLGDLAQNDPRTIEVRITNHLPVPMTVLGANSGCDQHACLAVETSLPFTIGAGETAKYSFKYLSRIVGPLRDEHDIYTDAGTFHLQLRGLVAAAPSPA